MLNKIKLFQVVGWGVNEKDVLSEQITAGSMPVVSDVECILSFATFFERFVTDNTFCAGRRNGKNQIYFGKIINTYKKVYLCAFSIL